MLILKSLKDKYKKIWKSSSSKLCDNLSLVSETVLYSIIELFNTIAKYWHF